MEMVWAECHLFGAVDDNGVVGLVRLRGRLGEGKKVESW